jgi:hypothetical protein
MTSNISIHAIHEAALRAAPLTTERKRSAQEKDEK